MVRCHLLGRRNGDLLGLEKWRAALGNFSERNHLWRAMESIINELAMTSCREVRMSGYRLLNLKRWYAL